MEIEEKRIPLLKSMGYSEMAIEFIINKTNVGEVSSPTLSAKNQGTCGDIMILHLKIEQDIITDAKYDYIGCAGLQAAASALTEMIIGISLKSAAKIESQDILTFLGGLPQQKHECAQLASNTLKKALETYFTNN